MLPTPPPSPPPSLHVCPEDLIGVVLGGSIELTSVIGTGAYGTVYTARDLVTDTTYAVKALHKQGLDARQRRFQDREIQLHYAASQHPNVVSLVKILDSPDCTYVVIEYCPEGDLFSKITEDGHYVGDDFKAKQVFLQILSAVQHCHDRGIYHRDLKPENILVADNGWTVKLADFGLATQERVTADFGCGSTFYMSPECQNPHPRTSSTYASAPNDVWSLGVVLANLTCGRNPWKRASMDDSTFRAFMRDRNFLRTILPISDELNTIFQRIFEVNPYRRISIEELRDLIVRCPRFTTGGVSQASLPSPQFSPVDKATESRGRASAYESVPRLDLPAQQFPQTHGYFRSSPPVLLTPPGSGPCSPQPTLYTSLHKSAAPVPPSGTFFGHLSDLRRCGQMFANLNLPANHLWTSTY